MVEEEEEEAEEADEEEAEEEAEEVEVAGEGEVEEEEEAEEAEEAEQQAVEEAGEGAGAEEDQEEEEEVEGDGNGSGVTACGEADPVTHRSSTSKFNGVHWAKGIGKWVAKYKGKYLGSHTTEEDAARALDQYVKDGVDPVASRGGTSSQVKSVSWIERLGKWRSECKGQQYLGYHATEEAATRAYDNYVEHGVIPAQRKDCATSQFKGVFWVKRRGLHSSTFQLNVGTFCGIEGALRGRSGGA